MTERDEEIRLRNRLQQTVSIELYFIVLISSYILPYEHTHLDLLGCQYSHFPKRICSAFRQYEAFVRHPYVVYLKHMAFMKMCHKSHL